MGVSRQIEIQITYSKEHQEKLFKIVENFGSEIKEHICKDKEFHASMPDVLDEDDEVVTLSIYSDRAQNAHWQMNCLIKLLQIHKVEVIEFSAEENQPTNVAYIDENDFANYEVDLS